MDSEQEKEAVGVQALRHLKPSVQVGVQIGFQDDLFESDSEDSFDTGEVRELDEHRDKRKVVWIWKGRRSGAGCARSTRASWKDSVCSTSKASNNHKVAEYGR